MDTADLDLPYLVRQLMDAVPNPWQAARMVEETLVALRKRVTEAKLYTNRVFLIQEMRRDLQAQVNAAAEALFRRKLADGEIAFRLVTSPEALNWELAETLEVSVTDADRRLNRGNGEPLERLLFEKVFEKDVNGLERPVALYLDPELSVRWWHRLVAKADWHLQGWQRNRVFPDFLVALNEGEDHVRRFSVLETKGAQLKGNDDTAYKQRLFDVLERAYNEAVEAGYVEVVAENDQRFIFTMLLEESWRAKMPQALGRA